MRAWIRVLPVVAALTACLLEGPAATGAAESAPAPGWSAATERTLAGGVREAVFASARPPGGPFDRISVHRYRGDRPARAALLYLPGTHMNGALTVPDEDHNLWLFLAARGVDVYALSYRTHVVPVDREVSLDFMKAWTLEVFVEDARAAARLARRESPGVPLFATGFSRGVQIAYAATYARGEALFAGLVALDGSFKHHQPAEPRPRAVAMERLEASGRFAVDVSGRMGWAARQDLMRRASENPAGPPTRVGSASTVGEELAGVLYDAWRPGGLANARDGFSAPEVLAQLLAGYDRYYPAVQDVDARALRATDDDPESPLDDGWGEIDLPILYIGSTGMGPGALLDGIYSASQSGSRDVTVRVLEGYGHLDVLVGTSARRDVFEPVLTWIEGHLGAR